MKKTSKLLVLIIALLLCVSLIALTGCQPTKPVDEDKEEEKLVEPSDELLISNGTFWNSTSSNDSFIRTTIDSWTAGSSTYATSSTVNSKNGVISVDPTAFNNGKTSIVSNAKNPGYAPSSKKNSENKYEDDKVLMLYHSSAASSFYTSANITVPAGKYYKISVDAYTDLPYNSLNVNGTLFGNVRFGDLVTVSFTSTEDLYYSLKSQSGLSGDSQVTIDNDALTATFSMPNNEVSLELAGVSAITLDNTPVHSKTTEGPKTGTAHTLTVDGHNMGTFFEGDVIVYNFTYSSTKIAASPKAAVVTEGVNAEGATTFNMILNVTMGNEDMNVQFWDYSVDSEEITYNITAEKTSNQGANILLRTGTAASFYAIDTMGEWKTYNFYVKGNPTAELKLTIELWLGYGNANSTSYPNKDLTLGFAFFDNVLMNEITSTDYRDVSLTDFDKLTDLNFRDPSFDGHTHASTASSYFTASKSSSFYSANNPTGDEAASISKSVYSVYDLTKLKSSSNFIPANSEKISAYLANKNDPTALYLYNHEDSSVSYKSTNKIQLSAGKTYVLSLWAYTYGIDTETSKISGDLSKGATVKLVGGDTYEAKIKTDGEWKQFAFIVDAHQLYNTNVTIEFWLGEGNKNDTSTLQKGGAIIDEMALTAFNNNADAVAYAATMEIAKNAEISLIDDVNADLAGLTDVVSADVNELSNNFEEIEIADLNVAEGDVELKILNSDKLISDDDFAIAGFEDIGFTALSYTPTGLSTEFYNVLMLKNSIYSASSVKVSSSITIKPNTIYRLSMFIKTSDLGKDLGLTIDLLDKAGKSIASFTKVNTSEKEDWVEYAFYIKGASVLSNEVSLKFTLGSGTWESVASLVKGAAFISAINGNENITASEFAAVTAGDTIKTYSFTEGSVAGTITNGSFTLIDLDKSEKRVDEYPASYTNLFNNSGALIGVALPASWDYTKEIADTGSGKAQFGVINADAYGLVNFFGNAALGEFEGSKNLLMMKSDYPTKGGFTSQSTSFSASKYYRLSVWAKSVGAATFSITIKNTSSAFENTIDKTYIGYVNETTGGEWVRYDFYIETGTTAINPQIELWYGNNYDVTTSYDLTQADHEDEDYEAGKSKAGEIYFSNITYTEIEKGTYDFVTFVDEYDNDLDFNAVQLGKLATGDTKNARTYVDENEITQNRFYVMAQNADLPYYVNDIVMEKLSFTVDSFDLTTEVTTSSTNLKGNTPSGWTWSVATGGSSSSEDAAYGVIDREKLSTEFQQAMLTYKNTETKKAETAVAYKPDIEGSSPAFVNNVLTVEIIELLTVTKDANGALSATKKTTVAKNTVIDNTLTKEEAATVNASDYESMPNNTKLEAKTVTTRKTNEATYNATTDFTNAMITKESIELTTTLYGDYANVFDGRFGRNVLLMSNLTKNGQTYTLSSGQSFNSDTYYEISLYAKAYALDGDKTAEIAFLPANDSAKQVTIPVSATEWKKYTFYIYNNTASAASGNYVAIRLGKPAKDGDTNSGFMTGSLLIDNYSLKAVEITKEQYTEYVTSSKEENATVGIYTFQAAPSFTLTVEKGTISDGTTTKTFSDDGEVTLKATVEKGYRMYRWYNTASEVSDKESITVKIDVTKTEQADGTFVYSAEWFVNGKKVSSGDNLTLRASTIEKSGSVGNYVWLYIATAIIGGLLLAAVIVVIVKKVKPKKQVKVEDRDYDTKRAIKPIKQKKQVKSDIKDNDEFDE